MASRYTYHATVVNEAGDVRIFRDAGNSGLYSSTSEKAAIKSLHDELKRDLPSIQAALENIRKGQVTRSWEPSTAGRASRS